MSGTGGRLFVAGEGPGQASAVFDALHLPGRTVFVRCAEDARAILEGHDRGAIAAAAGAGQSALAWVASLDRPVQALSFDADGRVTRDAEFAFASLPLRVAAGCRVTGSADGASYAISGAAGAITFGSAPVEPPHVRVAAMGPDAGRMEFAAKLAASDFAPWVRYFYSLPQQEPINAVQGLRYPVFADPAGPQVEIAASLDPAHPTDPRRNVVTVGSPADIASTFLTVAGEPIALRMIPEKSRLTQQWDPAVRELYWAPMGEWGIALPARPPAAAAGPSGSIDLMCGLSGLEYARIPAGAVIEFVPNAPAYAPSFPIAGAAAGQALTSESIGGLPVTTSWMYFAATEAPAAPGPSGQLGYFSQPEQGGLFRPQSLDPFLKVLPLETAGFPPGATGWFGAPAASFPMVPYAGVASVAPEAHRQFELEVLSPTRSNVIYAMNWPPRPPPAAPAAVPGPSGPLAVTPQGMLATFSDDYSQWLQLILASTQRGAATLALRNLVVQLRAALLTNQLFLVISDVDVFEEWCDVVFPQLAIADWTFDLRPDSWRSDTVLILKFAEKSLADLIADVSLWSAPGSGLYGSDGGKRTQEILRNVVAEAQRNAGQPEFAYFLDVALKDWNGILFVNVPVPPGDLPQQLRGLAAGLDLSLFKAHHFGINLSPVEVNKGALSIGDSSLFGLIYYDNPGDLTYQGSAYDFKVLSLRVLFANSDIASFSSQIELLVAQLFGEGSSLPNTGQGDYHGDNLLLDGVMQRHGDQESYSFVEQGTNVFAMTSHVLDRVLISKAQFVTLPPKVDADIISSQFLLWGTMAFKPLPEFDLFSFGPAEPTGPRGANSAAAPVVGLPFANLAVSMSYRPAATGPTGPSGPTGPTGPAERSFGFAAGNMVFDLAASSARPHSLYSRFPLQATAMAQGGKDAMPPDLGFIVIDSPLETGALGDPWFGLQMTLALGSQGSLAASAGLSATLLAAWAPNVQAYNAAVALKLPGSEGGSKSLTIQGPLKLTIGDIQLMFNREQQAYLMRFSNIALGFFGLKFPPGGQTNLLLFGDPDPRGANTTLGWYAAYAKDEKKDEEKNGDNSPALLPAGPRGLLAPPDEQTERGA